MQNTFQNLYKINKTLRFELKPIGKTLENIEKNKILESDKQKNIDRDKAKIILDEKVYIPIMEEKLSTLSFSSDELHHLQVVIENKQLSKKDKNKEIKKLTDKIINLFKQSEVNYISYLKSKKISSKLNKVLTNPGELITFALSTCNLSQEEKNTLETFNKFSTYLTEFASNTRAPKFEKAEVGSIAYRIINENFEIYRKNIHTIDFIKNKLDVDNAEKTEIINIFTQIDNITNFNYYLNQKGIDKYNQILGAIKTEEKQVQGLNEKINLYCQKNKIKKLPKIKQLYKLPLIKSETASFKFDIIEKDEQLQTQIKDFISIYKKSQLPTELNISDNIFLNGKSETLSFISTKLVKNYNEIYLRLFEREKGSNEKISEKFEEKIKKKIENVTSYQIKELNEILNPYELENKDYKSIIDFLQKHYKEIQENLSEKLINYNQHQFSDNIKNSRNDKLIIQELLDAFLQLKRYFKNFYQPDQIFDEIIEFYSFYNNFFESLDKNLNQIYNKTRNYLTKKPFNQEKFKLVFENAKLAKGWTKTKENDCCTFILKKDNQYYLGIWDNKNKTKKELNNLIKSCSKNEENIYQKFDLEFLPDATKMLK